MDGFLEMEYEDRFVADTDWEEHDTDEDEAVYRNPDCPGHDVYVGPYERIVFCQEDEECSEA